MGDDALMSNVNTTSNGAQLLTEAEAATILSVEPRTLRLWRNTRGLPHLKITNKVVRYRRSELDNWIDRCRVQMRGGAR